MSDKDPPAAIEEIERKTWAPPWLIDNIAEASRHARRVLGIYLAVSLYGLVTLLGVSDRQLALSEPLRLPLLGTGARLGYFLAAFLILIVFLFLTLQVYLQRLRGLVEDQRTRFAAERPRRLYPWLLAIADEPESGLIGILQRIIVNIVVWLSLPITAIVVSAVTVRKHEPLLSYGLGLLPVLVMLIVVFWWIRYETGLRHPGRSWIGRHWGKLLILAFVVARELIWTGYFVPLAQRGWPSGEGEAFRFLRPVFVLDLSHQRLVADPSASGTLWADLRNARLEGADLTASVLTRADLRNANLAGATLASAQLYEARLEGSDLRRANFEDANLSKSALATANLQQARLTNTDLRGAQVSASQLRQAESLAGAQVDSMLLQAVARAR